MKTVKVSILGFGTVGAGAAQILLENGEVIAKRIGVKLELVHIADLDITTSRGITVPAGILTTSVDEAINDADVVVELIGGTTVAKTFILKALNAGKHVVTANKALLATHGEELFAAAQANNVDLYYEASVAGGIPVIKALREGLAANHIKGIYGIMNGTCNYILTRMEQEGADFEPVLKDAQKLGYAEAEPSLDIDGFDTAHKTAILGALAYGEWFGIDEVYVEGIRNVSQVDLKFADELGYRIKLLAIIKEVDGNVQLRVHPTLIPKTTMLANISGVFNGVAIDGDMVGRTLFYGRGAGREATASAVVADICDIALDVANNCVGRVPAFRKGKQFTGRTSMDDIVMRYYLRLLVADQPGVLAEITSILAKHGISISSVVQHETSAVDGVELLILTHQVKERSIKAAIEEIESLNVVCDNVKLFRIEDI